LLIEPCAPQPFNQRTHVLNPEFNFSFDTH
jgi:hypothetical protein